MKEINKKNENYSCFAIFYLELKVFILQRKQLINVNNYLTKGNDI